MLGADRVLPLDGAALRGDAVTFVADRADDAAEVRAVAQPVLLAYAPATSNGRATLVIGGGGYVALMAGREGVQVARWLTGLGYHVFVLVHRFPDAANGPMAPLEDAIAAMRAIDGEGFGGIGVVGLSSGGHLAACLATSRAAAARRPDAMVIGYAPISTNAAGRTIVAGKPPLAPPAKQAFYDRLQPDADLIADPPPAFLVYAANDAVVPVENAWRLHRAWLGAGGTAECHIYADAPHGFALDTPDLPVSRWPHACAAWLRQIGFR